MAFPASIPRVFIATGFWFVVALLLSIGVAAYSMYSAREFLNAEAWIAIVGGNLLSCLIMIWVFARLRREIHQRDVAQLQSRKNARETEEQLELANKELESFSYSVSHDLRAPLRVIGGYAMMLEEDYAEKMDADGKRYLQVIRANTNKMDALIIDLMKLAKSTLTPLTLAVVDMRKLVQKALAELGLEDNPAISIGDLYEANANATLLLQVWQNLLANAVKFSGKQPRPAIHIGAQRTAQEIIYCIEDNGVGFDAAQTPKLFDVFQRFHSQDEFPGTGIGLALIKRIVLRHGGRVWAESQPGAGARFYFSLPHQHIAEQPDQPEEAPHP